MDMPSRAVGAALRKQYVDGGAKKGPPCASTQCLYVATKRVFWPILAGQEFPVYCDACAARAQGVLETLGYAYRDEPLPQMVDNAKTRMIDLED
jgi:hypothetical protein